MCVLWTKPPFPVVNMASAGGETVLRDGINHSERESERERGCVIAGRRGDGEGRGGGSVEAPGSAESHVGCE